MSFRFFRMYLKVPVVLLALIEAALFVFAPYQAAAPAVRFRRRGECHADRAAVA